jgi:RNA polymerase sigma-70 factor (ECF subfamily)
MSVEPAIRDQLLAAIPSLRAFAISLCGNPDRADDLVQDTLVKAWTHMHRFERGTNLNAWLFTILRNGFFSDHRKLHRRSRTATASMPPGSPALPISSPASISRICARRC